MGVESNLADFELAPDIQVLHHYFELLIRNLTVVILHHIIFTRSAFMIVLSTSCCNCRSVRLFPTIIFSTVKS